MEIIMIEEIIKKLEINSDLSDTEFKLLIESNDANKPLADAADRVRRREYGNEVYIRGLIEFTNYCKNNCFYCGIRCENKSAVRYRLEKEEILDCCRDGYKLGFRTFVLQGGEDPYFTDERMCDIISSIRSEFPDCAITLSLGEKSKEAYQKFFDCGANRYLLRHETAEDCHYNKLHPSSMSAENRKQCLFNLREIGFQTGSGFMVGSPFQTTENLISDLRFLQKLRPHMIGIGPYLRHEQTPFRDFENGDYKLTLRLVSILRLMFPKALIPSTTALGTINPKGREEGLKAGGNVVMPNLSPRRVRKLYEIYENKICTDEEAAESVEKLKKQVEEAGYTVVTDIGNSKVS